jgi:hypothetical protein
MKALVTAAGSGGSVELVEDTRDEGEGPARSSAQ